jgi:hypothetical protein
MKKIILLALFIIPILSYAQKVTQYTASNGITYHVKDTVMLNKGMAADSSFAHIWQDAFGPGGNYNLPGYYLHTGVAIKSIKKTTNRGNVRYFFMLAEGGLFHYTLDIEAAIAACEVTPCTQVTPVKQAVAVGPQPVAPAAVAVTPAPANTTPTMVADEIKKLKALLDSGAITKKEYNAQKKKLLNQ